MEVAVKVLKIGKIHGIESKKSRNEVDCRIDLLTSVYNAKIADWCLNLTIVGHTMPKEMKKYLNYHQKSPQLVKSC